jgi:hypothetical protein
VQSLSAVHVVHVSVVLSQRASAAVVQSLDDAHATHWFWKV